MNIFYDDYNIGTRRVDFLVEDCIIIELKAITTLKKVHYAQGINYLEAYKKEVGLIINFEHTSLQVKRIINEKNSIKSI